jgi:pimeloyl-ACP methyl ester carboxylesterase
MAERVSAVRGTGDVRIHVRSLDGPAGAPGILLHHGLASSGHIWDLMLPRLAERFRVVAYDARGHGRSAKPSSGYGFDRLVGDARAVIRATRLRRPIVVGHSWGAMVALHVAAHAPRSTSGVVLIDGGVGNLSSELSWEEVRELLAPPPLAGMPVARFRRMIPRFLGPAIEITPQVEEIVLSVMHVDRAGRIRPRLSRANHLRILREIWKEDHHDRHLRLRVPALAILSHGAGDPDWDAAKRDAARRLRRLGAPTRITWIEGIHDLPLQHPDRLCRRIERFATAVVG